MLRFIVLVLAGLTLWGGACLGAGPKAVAVADRSLWPRSMQSADDFDQASRAEILVFAKVFAEVEAAGEDWKGLTGVKAPHPDSIQRWLKQTKDVLRLNWAAAQSHCDQLAKTLPQQPAPGKLSTTPDSCVRLWRKTSSSQCTS
jgi:hypothetical protein